MVQNPKGGGLSSAFGGGNQIMGARKTSDFLEKTTWTLAIILVSLSLLANMLNKIDNNDNGTLIEQTIEQQEEIENKTDKESDNGDDTN